MSLGALARSCVALFVVSTAFPVVAGILNADRPPRWLGIADVAVAAVLFVVAVMVVSGVRNAIGDGHRIGAFLVGQRLTGVIPLLLVGYFVLGPRINWVVLVIGLAWRAWLLFYTLPSLLAALRSDATRAP
jgi:hypothetical protein